MKVSSPADVGGVVTEGEMAVKGNPKSNNFVRYWYKSAGNLIKHI